MKKEVICGIYKITSPSGRIYIGQSINIHSRWMDYRKPSAIEKYQKFIARSLKKHGWQSHEFTIVEICEATNLNSKEKYWISFFKSYGNKNGMNCSIGGEGPGIGIKRSKETRQKQSKRMMGKYVGDKNPNFGNGYKTSGEKHCMYGKKQSEEKKRKNSESNKKTWGDIVKSDWYNSEEQKQKRSMYNSGRTRSDEVRKKTKKANIETWAKIVNSEEFNSDEQKKIRSERVKAGLAKKRESPDYDIEEEKRKGYDRAKKAWATLRLKGYRRSEETRKKISDSHKKFHANKKLNNVSAKIE